MVKLSWGIKHAAIEPIYIGAILPLLTYGAPVWIDAVKYKHNRQKYIRVQRLINIKMAVDIGRLGTIISRLRSKNRWT